MKHLKETDGGFIGASDIAANLDRVQGMRRREMRSSVADWRSSVAHDKQSKIATEPEHVIRARKNLEILKQKKREQARMNSPKERFKSFIARTATSAKDAVKKRFQISEAFNMQDVVSRLKGFENKSYEDTVTYGVEDDDGNIMKVTVRAEQAKKFEQRMAEELAVIKTFVDGLSLNGEDKNTNRDAGKSIAELLYNLKNEFDIVDVEFPEIPSDVIYNTDKATYNAQDSIESSDLETDEEMSDQGVEDFKDEDSALPGEESEEVNSDDLDSAENFEEPSTAPSTDSDIIQSVLSMLKAEAEARKAGYEKEAEEYRARQAEYTYKLATHTASQQEEMAQIEAEMERQKEKEKEAKKYADIAKFRVQKMKSTNESVVDKIFEVESLESVASLMRMKQALRSQFAVSPTDTPQDKAFKMASFRDASAELDMRIRRARRSEQFNSLKAKKEQQEALKNKRQQDMLDKKQQPQPAQNQKME
jgi:hypothetical protein